MRKIMILMGLALLAFLVGCQSSVTGNVVKDVSSSEIVIPISELSETVKYYSYNDNGLEIRYLAVLGSDGEPRIAFDGCEVCGGSKGYQQDGTDVTCRNCGRSFKIDSLGTQNTGRGCWPAYLPSVVEDGKVYIKKSDLLANRKLFV